MQMSYFIVETRYAVDTKRIQYTQYASLLVQCTQTEYGKCVTETIEQSQSQWQNQW